MQERYTRYFYGALIKTFKNCRYFPKALFKTVNVIFILCGTNCRNPSCKSRRCIFYHYKLKGTVSHETLKKIRFPVSSFCVRADDFQNHSLDFIEKK